MAGPTPSAGSPEPKDREEIMTCVRFARYTSLTADRLTGVILALSENLENAGIIKRDRPSKAVRDQTVNKHRLDAAQFEQSVAELLKAIPNHPEAEALIESLFQDLDLPPGTIRAALTDPPDGVAGESPEPSNT
jgi:hypothetical protein